MPEPTLASPLAWPAGRPRTAAGRRQPGAFRSTVGLGTKSIVVADALGRLPPLMRQIGATSPVLTSGLELRLDGRARSGQRTLADPGAALYFQHRAKPVALSCDRYQTVAANIAAIAAHLDAARTIERHGVGTLEQMFAGFAALPSPAGWRDVLGHPATLAEAEAAFRDRARSAHPDAGGSHERMTQLNQARADARRAFGDPDA